MRRRRGRGDRPTPTRIQLRMRSHARRAPDEWMFVAWPSFYRWASRQTFRLRPGSRLRTFLLTRTIVLAYAGQNRGDWELSWALYDDDSVLENVPISGGGQRVAGVQFEYRGREGAIQLANDWRDIYPDLHFELVEAVDGGDGRLVVLSWLVGHGRASGVPVRERFGQLLTFEDGITRLHQNYLGSWDDCLLAVGLVPGD